MKVVVLLSVLALSTWAYATSWEAKPIRPDYFESKELTMAGKGCDSIRVDYSDDMIVITVFSHYYEPAPTEWLSFDERTGIGISDALYRYPTCVQDTTRIILPKRPKEKVYGEKLYKLQLAPEDTISWRDIFRDGIDRTLPNRNQVK